MSEGSTEFAGDADAAKVLQLMAGGLWRKARDAAKELCKKDCGRYLVLLIRANVGLVREMLGKGLVKEAETVVAYLATFAPAATPPTSAAMISTRRSRPWARSACGKSTPIPCPPPPTAAHRRLKSAMELAKIRLSDEPFATTHRSGRTARAGKKGVSLALIEPRERPKITKLENDFDLSFSEVH